MVFTYITIVFFKQLNQKHLKTAVYTKRLVEGFEERQSKN